MPIQGKFVINDATWSPLTLYGVGVFMAFSGKGAFRNHGGCSHIPSEGPIPPGRYWIVDRPEGTWKTQLKIAVWDAVSGGDHSVWFALYREDNLIDDHTWHNGVQRGNFRLHPGTVSEGCITLTHKTDFMRIRNALLSTQKIDVPGGSGLKSYGMIEVISNGTICP